MWLCCRTVEFSSDNFHFLRDRKQDPSEVRCGEDNVLEAWEEEKM